MRQLEELSERHSHRLEREGTLVGIVAAAVANWSMAAPREPRQPADFVPGLKRIGGIEDIPDEQAAAQIDAFFGKIARKA